MSYDLYFFARQPIRREEVIQYFLAMGAPYEIEREPGGDTTVTYINHLTGVYFRFRCSEPALEAFGQEQDATDAMTGLYNAGITFHLNLGRPTFFALEAMPQVEALARRFHLVFMNPQGDGETPVDECDAGQLIAGWQKTNKWACGALGPKPRLGRTRADALWQYMKHVPALREEFPDLFVPDIFVFHQTGADSPFTMITWWQAWPQIFPPCDIVVCGREHRRFFGLQRRTEDGVIDYPDLLTLIGRYLEPVPGPVPHLKMLPPRHCDTVQSILGRLSFKRQWDLNAHTRLPMDGFVDDELPA